MKSITMHKLDPVLAEELQRRARAEGRSLNQTAQDLLRTALGIKADRGRDRTDAFKDLHATWDETDLREFNHGIGDLERIDPADWEG